ncbi:phosphopyruvate hydratase [Paraburkholderia sp. BL25I1N1]|uniref:phosphopyruvate hydratase n=1 Tax=Paraburkholderia sp. BL25I1N1 TaxID=1938804 RepID=UPI000D07DE93|nr:phosphopyruvate hydratase [Paraburkholderia sp. BL25I1N1]PRX96449.1 enolase [Paraburkholderia sp. BL25I1N1]
MARIEKVIARRVWDSRGRPTVEVEIGTSSGAWGRGIAPAGASRGSAEAIDLRDGGGRFGGMDVQQALRGIREEIAPRLLGFDVSDQEGIDAALIELDGSPNKARLGGNATIATSLAALQAAAASHQMPLWRYLAGDKSVSLPIPQIQIFGGGAHAGRRVDIQDFMVIATGAKSFQQALEMTAEVYVAAGKLMASRSGLMGVADEGGWWPNFSSNEEALDVLVQAIEAAGYASGKEVAIALDIAASEFGREGSYRLALDDRTMSSQSWTDVLLGWLDKYPIVSIEDPLAEDDEAGLIEFTRSAGKNVQIVGDDYLVTNATRVEHAADVDACNAVLIKPNQAGTVTETRAALLAAQARGFATIVSARSGETEDTAIVHLATGWNAGQLKVGSFARSERMAKWNEAIRLEDSGLVSGGFVGRAALAGSR